MAADLVDTMDSFGHCVGLAAPQLGELVRMVAVDVTGHPKATDRNGLLVLVNPRIVSASGAEVGARGLPEHPRADRERPPRDRGRRSSSADGVDPLGGLRGALPAARDRPPRRHAVPRPRRLAHRRRVPPQAAGVGTSHARDGDRRVGRAGHIHEADVEPPPFAPDGVLVRVRAAGVNPVDTKVRGGYMAEKLPCHFPLILGWDVAGVVEQVGAAVTAFKPGDEVYGYCRRHHLQFGTYARVRHAPDATSPTSRGPPSRRRRRSRSPA